ncbi:plant UBX domain-containing protein 10 [Amaranthus tricolor]|uniref:plant UBX domain-containing protein 10 n=1 Tax=Amaranthus tricolor TaxID=29722 RepID=UPI00258C5C4D|nr:plant UBX domain-containing protein 10 [Amaranthus tricolor]
MVDSSDKLAYFQAITGVEDIDLCTEILAAHNWDLELAIATFTGNHTSSPPQTDVGSSGQHFLPDSTQNDVVLRPDSNSAAGNPSLAWRIVTLPISIVSGSLGLVSSAVGLGFWAAGGVLSYSFGMLGLGGRRNGESSSSPLVEAQPSAAEAMEFVASLEREYGASVRVRFVSEGFMDALQRSRHAYKLLFVYLHSPDHPDTPGFVERTIGNEAFAAFVNENFVAWGGSIRATEGFKMSNSLKASRFPFCAVVMAATNQRIALLQQIEGPKSPEEMLSILQRVLEETSPVLVSARVEAEERRNNMRLREEQDAAYRAALEADQARERQRIEEQERLERERAEVEQKQREEEEAREREAREAAEREAALARRKQEKALSLGAEPEKGPDVTQVLVRFPTGERKDRRFHSNATIQSIYDYVDSLDCSTLECYSLVSNFPRTVYGPDKHSLTLKEAGLHPQASLFVEPNL